MGTNSTVKRKFLTVYDYGTGAVSYTIYARNAEEIAERFPQLTIYDYQKLPQWATSEWITKIESVGIYDIDQEPTEFFRGLLDERVQKK